MPWYLTKRHPIFISTKRLDIKTKHVSAPLVLSCLVLSCLILSCLVLSCLVLSCLVLSCLVFFLVLSCLILSLPPALTMSVRYILNLYSMPCTLYPIPYALYPIPYALTLTVLPTRTLYSVPPNLVPYTLYPIPYIPYTLYTLYPIPSPSSKPETWSKPDLKPLP